MRIRGYGRCVRTGRAGSALLLAVVLTSLLAIVGMMFLMAARVEKTSASAVSENQDLDLAVDSVIARIEEVLTADVDPNSPGYSYYDYPDANNPWLAPLEPYESSGNYCWREKTDLYGSLLAGPIQAVLVKDSDPAVDGDPADADGDGVADSLWVELPDMTSSKGKPVYAAVRIIDNSAMLNVNTGFQFDPAAGPEQTDG